MSKLPENFRVALKSVENFRYMNRALIEYDIDDLRLIIVKEDRNQQRERRKLLEITKRKNDNVWYPGWVPNTGE